MTRDAKIICGDSALELAMMPDCCVHLCVTSPPYDGLRTAYESKFDFNTIAKHIFRILRDGGVLCWNVNSEVIDGSETLTPFKQAIFFVEQCGFRLHDTMLYGKLNGAKPDATRYSQSFEYVFVLSKGRPSAINLIRDKPNVTAGRPAYGKWTVRQKSGEMKEREYRKAAAEFGIRPNIWFGLTRGQEHICQSLPHPAMMPQWLARDLIRSWSNAGDTVLDPFAGSGTTGAAAIEWSRNAILIEREPSYIPLISESISKVQPMIIT